MTDNVLNKLESLRLATLIMCQSATAGKGEGRPSPSEVLMEAKKIHDWLKDDKG
jgi:hypothetical protein